EWLNIIENKNEFIGEIIVELDKKSNIIVNESENKIEKQLLGGWFDFIENESRIKKQFLESDEISKNFSALTEKLNNIYTSKPYNITEICARLSKMEKKNKLLHCANFQVAAIY
ncbi:21331_t:CDS:2, partial [Gigaspora margarita]